jgi:quercetin dioxygenase-like cupin family protein
MSIHHASSGELVPIHPLHDKLTETPSTALLKASQLEVIRRVLLAGKSVPEHQVAGEMTLLCLEGVVEIRLRDGTRTLSPNELVFLEGNVPYSLHAVENASLLITVALKNE